MVIHMANSMRPGIYTDYTITPAFSKNRGQSIGIAARVKHAVEGIQTITSLSQAQRIFGEEALDNPMMQLIGAVYEATAPTIYAVGVTEDTDEAYLGAVDSLFQSRAYLLTTDRKSLPVYQKIREKLRESGEKLAVLPTIPDTPPDELAQELNCERICVTYPPVKKNRFTEDFSAIGLTALISDRNGEPGSFNGAAYSQNCVLTEEPEEEEVETYLRSGVCVLETSGGSVTLIRGVTTRTHDEAGEPETSYRNLGVILTVDTVLPQLQETLRQKLDLTQNSLVGLNSILSLTVSRLEDFVDAGLLSGYDMPRITLDPDDASVCIVEIGFTVAQGISSIYLTAQITV